MALPQIILDILELKKARKAQEIREANLVTEIIRLTDQVTKLQLNQDSLLESREAQQIREADLYGNLIKLSEDVLRLKLNKIDTGVIYVEGQTITPAGYTLPNGAVVAPVTIVDSKDQAPADAALVLERTEIDV